MGFRLANTKDYAVAGSSRVVIKNLWSVECVQCGLRCSLDAVYDFKDVPKELHGLFLNLIQTQRGTRMLLPFGEHPHVEGMPECKPKIEEPKQPAEEGLWTRFSNWMIGR